MCCEGWQHIDIKQKTASGFYDYEWMEWESEVEIVTGG